MLFITYNRKRLSYSLANRSLKCITTSLVERLKQSKDDKSSVAQMENLALNSLRDPKWTNNYYVRVTSSPNYRYQTDTQLVPQKYRGVILMTSPLLTSATFLNKCLGSLYPTVSKWFYGGQSETTFFQNIIAIFWSFLVRTKKRSSFKLRGIFLSIISEDQKNRKSLCQYFVVIFR